MADKSDELLKFYIEQNERRHDEVKADIKEIKTEIQSLSTFKVQQMVNAKWVSFVISGIWGIATIVITAIISARLK